MAFLVCVHILNLLISRCGVSVEGVQRQLGNSRQSAKAIGNLDQEKPGNINSTIESVQEEHVGQSGKKMLIWGAVFKLTAMKMSTPPTNAYPNHTMPLMKLKRESKNGMYFTLRVRITILCTMKHAEHSLAVYILKERKCRSYDS